jgi:hypothetical protein
MWTAPVQGQGEEGIAQMRQRLAAQTTGSDTAIKSQCQGPPSCCVKCMRLCHNAHMERIAWCWGKKNIKASRTYILDKGSRSGQSPWRLTCLGSSPGR